MNTISSIGWMAGSILGGWILHSFGAIVLYRLASLLLFVVGSTYYIVYKNEQKNYSMDEFHN